jgi:hypothetical protein
LEAINVIDTAWVLVSAALVMLIYYRAGSAKR